MGASRASAGAKSSIDSAIAVPLPLPWPKASHDRQNALDGLWKVRYSGVDAAGNACDPVDVELDVALDGPEMELVRPAPSTTWPRNAQGRFELEVLGRDPETLLMRGSRIPLGVPSTHAQKLPWTS